MSRVLKVGSGIPAALSPELAVWTSYLLRQAGLRVQDRVFEELASLGLRPSHNSVLTVLASGALSQVVIAGRLRTDRTTMVRLLDELEDAGLVVRRRNPRDRRAHEVTLTEDGAAMLERTSASVSAADADFFAPLLEAEREQFRAMLIRLISAHDEERRAPHQSEPRSRTDEGSIPEPREANRGETIR